MTTLQLVTETRFFPMTTTSPVITPTSVQPRDSRKCLFQSPTDTTTRKELPGFVTPLRQDLFPMTTTSPVLTPTSVQPRDSRKCLFQSPTDTTTRKELPGFVTPLELLPNLETEEDLEKVFKEVSEENSEIEIDGTDENTDAESVESERELNDSGSTSTTIEVVSEEVETPIIRIVLIINQFAIPDSNMSIIYFKCIDFI
ncbi:unnamed protein product [Mytilus edulis]|uniref:Uncharacterized protein n=1 Tax=Mytilus edulis TaxID=6550 RepID=A0A8S3SVD2_MYTED|nr:unnamed protein product [Mytilus edulis]